MCPFRTLPTLLLLLAFLAGSWSVRAQSPLADSLAVRLRTAPPDSHRVVLLLEYAWEINEVNTDAAARSLQEAINLARQLNFRAGEGAAWNGLGIVEEIRGNLSLAEAHYNKALELRRKYGTPQDVAGTLNNLGLVYELAGKFNEALAVHQESLRLAEDMQDTLRIARAHLNMAGAFEAEGLYPEAQTQINEARLIFENRQDASGMAKTYTMLGHIHFELDRYEAAYEWYGRSLELREKIDDPDGLAEALNDYANALDEMDSCDLAITYYLRALSIWEKMDDQPGIATVFVNLGDAYKHLKDYPRALEYLEQALRIRSEMDDEAGLMEVYNTMGDVYRRQGKLQLAFSYTERYFRIAESIHDEKYIQRAYKDFAALYEASGDYRKAYEYRVLYDEYRYNRLDEQMTATFARKEALFADQKKQQEIERQKTALALRDAQLSETQTRNRALVGGAIGLLLLAALLFNRNRIRARANRDLAAKNVDIERERQRADDLLVNILPATTAEELKQYNRVKPVRYDSVTVLFSDFKNFTAIAEQMQPEELVQELDEYFRLFDTIIDRFGLEKIKTIGDAYMCAGGLPTPNDTHPVDVVCAAIEMQRELQALMVDKQAAGKPVFEMRIGVHTGPVVAGVVGSRKFAYDIWGDTVNTAARLEQGSAAGKINISEVTYGKVMDRFPCSFRGRLAAKNKGEIAMYYVEYDGPMKDAGQTEAYRGGVAGGR